MHIKPDKKMEQIPSFSSSLISNFYTLFQNSNKPYTWPFEYNLIQDIHMNQVISHHEELLISGSTLYTDQDMYQEEDIHPDIKITLNKLLKNIILLKSSHSCLDELDWTCILKCAMTLEPDIPEIVYFNTCKRLIQFYGSSNELTFSKESLKESLNKTQENNDDVQDAEQGIEEQDVQEKEIIPYHSIYDFNNIKEFL